MAVPWSEEEEEFERELSEVEDHVEEYEAKVKVVCEELVGRHGI